MEKKLGNSQLLKWIMKRKNKQTTLLQVIAICFQLKVYSLGDHFGINPYTVTALVEIAYS